MCVCRLLYVDDQEVVVLEHNAVSLPLLVLELFPRQAIASHPHNKHCITHPQERNVHHMYQEEGPVGYNQLSVYTPRPLSNPYTTC